MARSSAMKNSIPIAVGFMFGSVLSVFLIPSAKLTENGCSKTNLLPSDRPNSLSHDSPATQPLSSPLDSRPPVQNVETEQLGTTKIPAAKTVAKTNRPRFYATELGIRDKLFVGVVTSRENLPNLAAAINKTVAHHVSKLMFFVDAPEIISSPMAPRYLNLVNIAAETPDNLKPFAILNYIAGRGHALANNYDWFYFMPDSVYLKAFKLFELVAHMSFGYDVQIGRPWMKGSMANDTIGQASPFCDFNAGILLSFGLMRSVLANLRQCMKRVDPTSTASENFGRCILYANDVATCSEEWNGKLYRSWPLSTNTEIATNLPALSKHDLFNSALTVYPIPSASDIFHLHKYYCNQEIEQINQLINTLEQNLLASSLSNTSVEPFAWPPGFPPPSKQRSRYELLKWDYFSETDLFECNNDQNVRALSGVNGKDVKDVVEHAVKTLATKYPLLRFQRLLNGYRRFDPRRGMDYMLDLQFDAGDVKEVVKRVHLTRPLNRVELVPVPYVTEATQVIVVVPVSPGEASAAQAFLDRFSRICFDADENARLIFVLFYENRPEQDSYKELVNDIETSRKKYGFGDGSTAEKAGKLEYLHIRSAVPSTFLLMDLMLQTVGRDHLYLMATPWTEVYGDFLNRVRMNTIKEFQVFFPIPFAQFNPKIVYRNKAGGIGAAPEHIDVHKNVGRFDRYDFSIGSFYGSDYHVRRKLYAAEASDRLYFDHDLLSIFFNSTLHIFRGVEPALKIRYHDKRCDARIRDDFQAKCTMSRAEGLGTKSQLATLLYEFGAIDDGL